MAALEKRPPFIRAWRAGGLLSALAAALWIAGCGNTPPGGQPPPIAQPNPPAAAAPATNAPAATPAASAVPAAPPKAEKLLLLDDGPEDASPAAGGADNSRCHVCHINFVKEDLTASHAKAGIGCAKCHGASDAHIADESWASGGNGTAPDTMFPKAKINGFCLDCHPQDKIASPAAHESFLAGKEPGQTCTDCHGKHRMTARKCKWK